MNRIMHGKTKSLYHAITMALGALVSFLSISVGLINYFYQAREATALYNNKSSEYARYLHNELEWPLWNVDDELIRKIGNTFTSSTEIALLTILDDQQRVVYHNE